MLWAGASPKKSPHDGASAPGAPGAAMRLLKDLQVSVAGLQAESRAIRSALEAAGLLTQQAILAHLHRMNFEAARQDHPCTWRRSLLEVLESCGGPSHCVKLLASSAGMKAACALLASCRGTASSWQPAIKLVVCGGRGSQEAPFSAECLNLRTRRWEALVPPPRPMVYASAAVVGGRLYVCGGQHSDEGLSVASNAVDRYNPMLECWEESRPMSERRMHASAVSADGLLFVCGGVNERNEVLATVECFRPKSIAWEALPPMLCRRASASAACLSGCRYKVFVCGGSDGVQRSDTAEFFPSDYRHWNTLPAWQETRECMPRRRGGATAVADAQGQRIYVCGGQDGQQVLTDIDVFDAHANGWHVLRSMPTPRTCAVAISANMKVYVFGGYDGRQVCSAGEYYNPTTCRWQGLPPMAHRRTGLVGGAVVG
mmetsp:Transcript_156376/g.299886  ORF Transcript_156376/g.299886 Transcript_156376/m.299886 type:complete len:429 (-) Transcript_156376:21-1307(-)